MDRPADARGNTPAVTITTSDASAAKPAAKAATRSGRFSKSASKQNQVRRTRVAVTKTTVLSPEARAAAEERNRKLIEEYIAAGKVKQCPARWAPGAVQMTMFGTEV